ncbi:hypothetical protein L6452_00838 [Arctium lappa]|uniref:Uncharacterized protein n=1 Tax=Arctium lappa TaxID=4217 RepID=A0ACB9FF20_ARCLA|nr:hypothetical protein L6452_00838 [Arctium lappa]
MSSFGAISDVSRIRFSLNHTHTHTASTCGGRAVKRVSASEDSKLFHPANQQLNRLQISEENTSWFK